ncbi:uncharacterized protein DDB_G0286299-like [Paramacrobiotus metropolitanus]|uniref:uncharacterized protein DDB_G0286299-like n=1 Tax=Paramacrobiotus metropolitanus TaxID=2943436 RepID=UPI002445CE09|nr:uncharacterized protein DDB_G0286299-like [Paramacrobiotus metropolitanus]
MIVEIVDPISGDPVPFAPWFTSKEEREYANMENEKALANLYNMLPEDKKKDVQANRNGILNIMCHRAADDGAYVRAEEEGHAGEGEDEEQMEAEDAPSGENAPQAEDEPIDENNPRRSMQRAIAIMMGADHKKEEEDDDEDTVQEESEDEDPAPRTSKDESKSKSSKEESKPRSSKTDTKSKKSEKSDKGTDKPGKTGTEKSKGKEGKRKDQSPSDDEESETEDSEDDDVVEIDESQRSSTTTPKKGVIRSATSPEEKPKPPAIAIKRAINMGQIMAASTQKERREKAQKEKGKREASRESTASESGRPSTSTVASKSKPNIPVRATRSQTVELKVAPNSLEATLEKPKQAALEKQKKSAKKKSTKKKSKPAAVRRIDEVGLAQYTRRQGNSDLEYSEPEDNQPFPDFEELGEDNDILTDILTEDDLFEAGKFAMRTIRTRGDTSVTVRF